MKRLLFILIALGAFLEVHAQHYSGTYLYATRDTCNLYLDVYQPSAEASPTFNGHEKPTVLFLFGGGFISGERNNKYYMPWFKLLNDNGYRVVSIDYRLGLKGIPMRFDLFHLIDAAKKTQHAVNIGVEDVFSAVRFLTDHAGQIGLNPANMVIAGSSAGAMISLSSEWEICNRTPRTAVLPEGFQFTGVMSFAGAIMSDQGVPDYKTAPCPQLLFHGTADGAVAYKKMAFGRRGMFGSHVIAGILAKKGYPYNFYRHKDHTHDIAGHFLATWPEQKRFLEENVMDKSGRTIDAMVDDPAVPHQKSVSLSDIYK